MDVEKVFENVTGRKMSPDEVTRYLKFQKEFEIPDTDAIWMMFIWFEFYQRIFEQFPTSARAECEAVTRQIKEASATVVRSAAAEIDTMTSRTKQEIAKALGQSMTGAVDKAIAQITESVAVQAAKAQARKWLSIGGGVILLVILLTGGGSWYYFSNQINQVRTVDAVKLRAVEEAPPTTLSLECNAPGEEIQVGNNGQRWCTRLLPPQ
ncbi:MAG: hypothetical protein VST70_05270 [Nitrospirota bacterium]|nr:hypothetical protein [Nitrospirota bacterium]